jgi:hypothetical protein
MNVEINPSVLAELEYLVELHGKHGAPNPVGSVEDLVEYVLDSIADNGSGGYGGAKNAPEVDSR